MDIKEKFGKNLKRLRLEKGLSQEKLALEAGLDRTYIPSIEKGARNVSITVVEKLSIALNVEFSEFFKN
ncbi:MAG: helix-turn-helix domain-containing protein [Saprospiraceae bacterium]